MKTDKEKLTFKEVVGYLPYGLKILIKIDIENTDYFILSLESVEGVLQYGRKPILRPLSDLTKEITHNGETFVPIEKLQKEFEFDDDFEITEDLQILLHNTDGLYYFPPNFFFKLYNKLYEWHFDVYKLIERKLAVNLNDLPNE